MHCQRHDIPFDEPGDTLADRNRRAIAEADSTAPSEDGNGFHPDGKASCLCATPTPSASGPLCHGASRWTLDTPYGISPDGGMCDAELPSHVRSGRDLLLHGRHPRAAPVPHGGALQGVSAQGIPGGATTM